MLRTQGYLRGFACPTLLVQYSLILVYGITCLIRLIQRAALFTTLNSTCVRQVVLDKSIPPEMWRERCPAATAMQLEAEGAPGHGL